MARKPTPAPESRAVAVNEGVVAGDVAAANALALAQREADARGRAVAAQLGYHLPADSTDPDLIQRDIAANMRRSVEACLEVGRGLTVLKATCPHGAFTERLDTLGIDVRVAQRFMLSATKFANAASTPLLKAVGNQTKLFEMLVLEDEQLEELSLTGQTGELALDDVATMSVKELRAAVREARGEKAADAALLTKKNAKIDKLEREAQRIKKLPLDEAWLALQREATGVMNDARGAIVGGLRQALIALRNEAPEGDAQDVFMAGLVGQIQADLTSLREEFQLPDVSSAADQELAEDVAKWDKP